MNNATERYGDGLAIRQHKYRSNAFCPLRPYFEFLNHQAVIQIHDSQHAVRQGERQSESVGRWSQSSNSTFQVFAKRDCFTVVQRIHQSYSGATADNNSLSVWLYRYHRKLITLASESAEERPAWARQASRKWTQPKERT